MADLHQFRTKSTQDPWAVVLAGGDGVRLRPLSRLISGDDRPKQFCPIIGDRSLLAHTRNRLAGMTRDDHTLFVVNRQHETYYANELSDVHPGQLIVQPMNRGTGAAIAWSLLRIIGRDPDAVVAFFPSDHYYSDESIFRAATESAVRAAAECPNSLVLLGAEASYPETEYGWMEPGPALAGHPAFNLYPVRRFWEKPSYETAQSLQMRGCLWNTFVMVGRASAFFCLLQSSVPGMFQTLSVAERTGNAAQAYMMDLQPVDFSQQVLSRCTAQLLVIPMAANVGWSDLGEPGRVLATLDRVGIAAGQAPLRRWLPAGQMEADPLSAAAA